MQSVPRKFFRSGFLCVEIIVDCNREVPGCEIQGDLLAGRVPRCLPCVEAHKSSPEDAPPKKTKTSKPKKKTTMVWDEDSSEEEIIKKIPGVMKVSMAGKTLT